MKYSPNIDAKGANILDVMEEGAIRVYPYVIPGLATAKTFIKNGASSIVAINQNFGSDFDLLTDENGNVYFEILASDQWNTLLDIANQTNLNNQTLKIENTTSCLTNTFPTQFKQKYSAGNFQIYPLAFFIGKPYNEQEYKKGLQPAFFSDEVIAAKEGTLYSQSETEINPEGLYEFTLIPHTNIESSYTNARILFFEYASALTDPSVRLRVDGASLLGRILVSGILEEDGLPIEDYIDLTINQKLIPFKFTPISIQDKVTMFADWFDYDVVMPELIARHFNQTQGASIESLKQLKFTVDGKEQSFFTDSEVNLIKDIIAVSAAYASEFSQFARYTAEEAKNAGGGAKEGDIKGNLTIAHDSALIAQGKALKVVALVGKDPIKVIDGIVETYLRAHPTTEDTFQWVAVKEVLTGISRYIYTQYAIGKGQNAFNEIYLPWFLRPVGAIGLKVEGTNYVIENEVNWKLYSNYFDLTTTAGDILLPNKTNISDVRVVQTDRKLTLPEIPNSISASDKLPLPGDIDTRSNNDLQYIWYLPIPDDNKAKALFLNEAQTSSAGNDPVPFTTIEHPYKTGLELQPSQYANYLTDWYRRYNTLSAGTGITYNSEGTVAFREKTIRFQSVSQGGGYTLAETGLAKVNGISDQYALVGYSYNYGNNVQITYEDGSKSPMLTVPVFVNWSAMKGLLAFKDENSARTWITNKLLSKQIISNTDMLVSIKFINGRYEKWWVGSDDAYNYQKQVNGFRWDSLEITFKEQYFDGAKVLVTGSVTTTDYKREVAFDKPKWRKMLADLVMPQRYMWLTIQDEQNFRLDEVRKITLTTMWSNSFMLDYNNNFIEIPSFNKDDETITVQDILLI